MMSWLLQLFWLNNNYLFVDVTIIGYLFLEKIITHIIQYHNDEQGTTISIKMVLITITV